MMKLVSGTVVSVLILFGLIGFTYGLGKKVEVPPAHVGMILTKNGWQPETLPPSKFRLAPCIWYCDKLILLQTTDVPFKESMPLFMPQDQLNLQIDVRGTLTIANAENPVRALFSRVAADQSDDIDADGIITIAKVYQTYGQQVIRGVVRNKISEYSISEVIANRQRISDEIFSAVRAKLDSTNAPIIVSRLELADVVPPAIVVQAQEAAKEREIQIRQAEADAKIELTKAQRALEVAKQQRLVDREKALAIKEQNEITATAVTPQWLAFRKLEVLEQMAQNQSAMFLPTEMLNVFATPILEGKMIGNEMAKAQQKATAVTE